MEKIKIAICDDEVQFAKNIKEYIVHFFENKGVVIEVDSFLSGNTFLRLEKDMLKYQIVFLDINMIGVDGIETAKKLRELSETSVIIFVTAFIEYTLAGYKVEALRYILKTDTNFEKAIYEGLEAAMKKLGTRCESVTIPFQSGIKKIEMDQIVYIESQLHNLHFYIFEDGVKKYSLRGTMADSEKYVKSEKIIRIHQSYRINLEYSEKIYYNRIVCRNGLELPISKTYSKKARDCFYNYKGEI